MTTTLRTFDANDSVEDIAATLQRDGGVIIRGLAPERLRLPVCRVSGERRLLANSSFRLSLLLRKSSPLLVPLLRRKPLLRKRPPSAALQPGL